ncbi:MAG TPA: hypothetical protein VMF70_12340 [Gemmatimonadales bacterium]|nr:hypothetical protein [Gemmatimonadales bacterium]
MKRLLPLLLLVPSVALAQKDSGGPPDQGPRRHPGYFDQDSLAPPARRAYGIGILAYTGGTWQPSGFEVAMLWRLSDHSSTAVGATLALGSFIQDQAVLFGQSQGFFVTLGGTLRRPLVNIADVGSERTPATLRLEASVDAAGTADIHTPLPQGPWGARAALLLGLSFGGSDPLGQSVGLYYGPAVLLGRTTSTHGEFALRFRMAVSRR